MGLKRATEGILKGMEENNRKAKLRQQEKLQKQKQIEEMGAKAQPQNDRHERM